MKSIAAMLVAVITATFLPQLGTASTGFSNAVCPAGFVMNSNFGDDYCFYAVPHRDNFDHHEQIARDYGGYVLIPLNGFETNWISDTFYPLSPFYLGVRCSTQGACFRLDGQTLNYTNWAPGFPDASKGACVATNYNSVNQWFNVECSEVLDAVVKIRHSLPNYEDNEARTVSWPIATYLLKSQEDMAVCLKAQGYDGFMDVVHVRCLEVDWINSTDLCYALMATDLLGKKAVVSFRSTRGWQQVANEVIFFGFEGFTRPDGTHLGRASTYFLNSTRRLWDKAVRNFLLSLDPTTEVRFTGYSLGGAQAALTLALAAAEDLEVVSRISSWYSYGEPRAVDDQLANWLSETFRLHYRVVHALDGIVREPPAELGFRHTISEVHYMNVMKLGDNFTICYSQEDRHCSAGFHEPDNGTPSAHESYFDAQDPATVGCQGGTIIML